MERINALLLLGPTGSGKTPLGQYLEENGFAGKRCLHFDFGENLRNAAAGEGLPLEQSERAFLRDVLERGALLENEKFYIAVKIFEGFSLCRGMGGDDLLIMNGLPRHVGQADNVDTLVNVGTVLSLKCSPETVIDRIRLNTGGDRQGRDDDSLAGVRNKLKIFDRRTRPLFDYYRAKGANLFEFTVELNTPPDTIVRYMTECFTEKIGIESTHNS